MRRGFLPQDKEVPTRLAIKASKEGLTQEHRSIGKKTDAAGLFSGATTIILFSCEITL